MVRSIVNHVIMQISTILVCELSDWEGKKLDLTIFLWLHVVMVVRAI